jgi:hypothetical protein
MFDLTVRFVRRADHGASPEHAATLARTTRAETREPALVRLPARREPRALAPCPKAPQLVRRRREQERLGRLAALSRAGAQVVEVRLFRFVGRGVKAERVASLGSAETLSIAPSTCPASAESVSSQA